MKSNIIITKQLKSELTSKSLKNNLKKLFNFDLKDLNIISIQIKLELPNRQYKSLGNKFIINIKNRGEIHFYINYLITKYDSKFLEAYQTSDITTIKCLYSKASLNEHKTFRRELDSHKTFIDEIKTGIKPFLNIPFNNQYDSLWGNIQIISKDKFIINDIRFNDDIHSINMTEFIGYKTLIKAVIIFKAFDKKNIHFTDSFNSDNNLKREFTQDNQNIQTYFFNPKTNNPIFMIDKNILPIQYKKDKDGKINFNERINIITSSLNYTQRTAIAEANDKKFNIPKFKALTFDVETYYEYINNVKIHKLLCICFFDGKYVHKFYRSDYGNDKQLLTQCFNKLLIEKFNNFDVYMHNGSKFDIIFIIEYLLNRKGVRLVPLYKDGIFISIKLYYDIEEDNKKNTFCITIKDSMLILLSSLSKLGKAFNVETQKDIFPYDFPNIDNLNYIGIVPEYKYFDSKVTILEYNKYKERFKDISWNLKLITLDYCSKDCISLYQILSKFKDLIDEKFEVDLQKCPTITSLAFKIFRSNYYNDKKTPIPLLTKDIFKELKDWFFGGHVDVYIPSGPKNANYHKIMTTFNALTDKSIENIKNKFSTIKHYDVNSLYPSVMKNCKYPTDIICKFLGNIKNTEFVNLYNDKLGIYYVKVKAPNIKNPILPIRIKNKIIYGYGSWTGYYFSEEIKNAEKYGYTFEILGGYIFESANIFEKYVNALYKIKENSSKDNPMYLISKILMNSLFGRFGLNPWLGTSEFILNSDLKKLIDEKLLKMEDIEDKVDFTNHTLITRVNNNVFASPAFLPIAMSVTSYSRIEMSHIKNKDNINIYYSDTDSIFTDSYLPEDLVHNKAIGKWKLEDEYIYSIFLGPKLYGCVNCEGKSYSKVKGYRKYIGIDILESLLNIGETKKLLQTKWFRIIKESKIEINTTDYTVQPTDNKRILIYKKNRLVGTESLKINIVENNKTQINPNNKITQPQ